MKKCPFTKLLLPAPQGKECVCLVDNADLSVISGLHWIVGNQGYAVATKDGKVCLMHRLILGFPSLPRVTDHINRNKLDNRRCNLRVVSVSDNNANCIARKHSKTGIKGVRKTKTGRFVACLTKDYKQHFIGTFDTLEQAEYAYQQFRRQIRV
jgi:hypothetical protein